MDERKNRTDLTHGYQSQTFVKEFAARFEAQRVDSEKNPEATQQPENDPHREPTPPEALMRAWEQITTHATGIMAVFTILLFAATMAYSVIARLQWGAMKDQLKQMTQQTNVIHSQLEMADRPWIKDTARSFGEFSSNNGGFSWAVSIRAENVGHSVATAIFPQTKLIAIHGADFVDAPRQKARDLCDEVSARFEKGKSDPVVYNAIFPGDSSEFVSSPVLGPDEINKATVDGGAKAGKSVMPMLIGCIEYHYATSEKPHKTWFVYTLVRKDDPALPLPTRVFFTLGKSISSSDIVLIKADQFAD